MINITEDNFSLKSIVFYNQCQLVGLSLVISLEAVSIILISPAQIHYYANFKSIVLFNKFYQKI